MSKITPEGTQVVLTNLYGEIRSETTRPRGALGVVVQTPADGSDRHLVRLPDGIEDWFTSEEFWEWEHFQYEFFSDAWQYFEPKRYTIYEAAIGLGACGFEVSGSKNLCRLYRVYFAPASMHASLNRNHLPAGTDTIECSFTHELHGFVRSIFAGDPFSLECLFSPGVMKKTRVGEEMLALREWALSKRIYLAYTSFALLEFDRFREDQRGGQPVPPEAVANALRLLGAGAAILREKRFVFCDEAHRDRLNAILADRLSWLEIEAWSTQLHRDFGTALRMSKLWEYPNDSAGSQFLIKALQGRDEEPIES